MKKTNEKLQRIIFFIAGAVISFSIIRVYDSNIKSVEWQDNQIGIYVSPFVAETKQPEPISEPEIDINEVVRRVRILESSNGTAGLAVTCKNRGLSNEYGYNPPKCHNSHEELTTKVKNWFERKLAVMTLNESLCFYNLGIQMNSCDYVNKFNNL